MPRGFAGADSEGASQEEVTGKQQEEAGPELFWLLERYCLRAGPLVCVA